MGKIFPADGQRSLRRRMLPLLVLLSIGALSLTGCIYPLQAVSPDPTVPPSAGTAFNPADFTLNTEPPVAPGVSSSAAGVTSADIPSDPDGSRAIAPVAEPRLALLWYAMADADVYSFRQAFAPVLESAGFPFREYDAENDRYQQADQLRNAVADGWNVLLVQPVPATSVQDLEALLLRADGRPVIFLGRIQELDGTGGALLRQHNAILLCTDPADAGRVQGRMIAEYLLKHDNAADRNGDGSISYVHFLESDADLDALIRSKACIETANALLSDAGYPPLRYFDPAAEAAFQTDTNAARPSDAANNLMNLILSAHNDPDGDPIELVIADSDELALGALTSLQSFWYNLGDGTDRVIPLFGYGTSSAALAAVGLGQMSGTVDDSPSAYARALVSLVQALQKGGTVDTILSALAAGDDALGYSEDAPAHLTVLPVAVIS